MDNGISRWLWIAVAVVGIFIGYSKWEGGGVSLVPEGSDVSSWTCVISANPSPTPTSESPTPPPLPQDDPTQPDPDPPATVDEVRDSDDSDEAVSSPTVDTQQSPLNALSASAASFTGPVSRVIDGDTLIVGSDGTDIRVRLAAIDAPEMQQDYGVQAKDALQAMVSDKTVFVENLGVDQYGRVIGVVTVDDENINQKLVATGNAWFWSDYANELDYRDVQREADQARLGLWANRAAISPWLYRKLEGIGVFGKAVMSGGFYLDGSGTLHNSRCNISPRYRWDGTGSHANCDKCGGSIF